MVLLITILCVMRETPLSRWTWQLEPNSVFSILTTASKTALMVPSRRMPQPAEAEARSTTPAVEPHAGL
ncbi:hypothetical protein CMUS01_15438 [Colletotrichum musicola]|uniref:Uncharacterized protein n=1 Tax=Colletotrichum musicola TaxID=2175873 RepID=A0A8H6IXH1_9PEZI|nr:hypothetical protein CMUS01_15438 [Colletotrichum musicola]